MKQTKIIYWASTVFLFLFEGVMPALTGHTEMAKEGIRHLGYPDYFGTMLVVAKVLGAIAITLPFTPARLKEWAYAGLFFDFISAFISHWVVSGFGSMLVMPLVLMLIWAASYFSYHRLKSNAPAPTFRSAQA
ncbi:MAG TPA: DoxX family protein [Flavihumibacter sp.]|jgi:hypothetical protein